MSSAWKSSGASLSHRLGVEHTACDYLTCAFDAPPGDYTLLAVRCNFGRVQLARYSGTHASKKEQVTLDWSPAPPLSGVVRTDGGVPMPGVPLQFIPLRPQRTEASRVLTRLDGSFEAPLSCADRHIPESRIPVWQIEAEPPWRLPQQLISIGDEPVELILE